MVLLQDYFRPLTEVKHWPLRQRVDRLSCAGVGEGAADGRHSLGVWGGSAKNTGFYVSSQ